jgi:HEAT repeat protein
MTGSRRRAIWTFPVVALGLGCSIAPKGFHHMNNPAPLVRARAAGLGRQLPDAVTIPALIDRLNDTDQVVRLSASEELKRRTGQDFGFVAWDDPGPRAQAVARWTTWYNSRIAGPAQVPARRR